MKKKTLLLLAASLLAFSSCEELCEKGIYPFCDEGSQPSTPGVYIEKAVGPDGQEMTTFTIGNKGYVGAGGIGYPPVFDPQADFYSYDPETHTWDSIADLPAVGRLSAVGFATASHGYVGGGYYYEPGNIEVLLEDFYSYDPATNSWTRKADMPGGPGNYVGFGIGNKGYAIKDGKFWEYSPANDVWIPKADCPVPTGFTFSVGSKGYIINKTELYEYNPLTNTWSAKAKSPREAFGATFATKTRGYLVEEDTTFEYNPQRNIWTKKAATPAIAEADQQGYGLHVQYGFGIKDKGYIGIHYRSLAKHFFEYDPNK